MTEQENQYKETVAFLEKFEPKLREGWENLDLDQGNFPLSPDPFNLNMEGDERDFEDLPDHLKTEAIKRLYDIIGFDPLDPSSEVRRYKTSSPDRGDVEVTVYRTNRSDEGFFYHEQFFLKDKVIRPALSSEEDL